MYDYVSFEMVFGFGVKRTRGIIGVSGRFILIFVVFNFFIMFLYYFLYKNIKILR